VFNGGNSNKEFFRNITNVFLESDYMKNILENKFRLKTKLGTQHFYSVGYPDLEKYFDYKTSDKIKSIIWTPRWSYDERIGGSHFIEYMDILFDLKEKYPYNSFIFRPHPLMFGELKNKQLASQTEIDEFLEKIKEYSIEYDHDTMMDQAIEKADLMITDYSSIIINYFLTGKPIIYCKAQYELNEEYSKIEKCMYVAKSKTDIQRYVEMLLSGNDPLKESRKKLIESYSNKHSGATKRITDILINEI
jgi:CDP-glycerol glycerophosphotransferase (TagB/SpsB family)